MSGPVVTHSVTSTWQVLFQPSEGRRWLWIEGDDSLLVTRNSCLGVPTLGFAVPNGTIRNSRKCPPGTEGPPSTFLGLPVLRGSGWKSSQLHNKPVASVCMPSITVPPSSWLLSLADIWPVTFLHLSPLHECNVAYFAFIIIFISSWWWMLLSIFLYPYRPSFFSLVEEKIITFAYKYLLAQI